MALGPGALQLLLQPTHVQNRASGDGVFKAAEILDRRKKQAFDQEQSKAAFAEDTRRFDLGYGLDSRKQGLEEGKFVYQAQEALRKRKAAAYDELQEALLSKNPEIINAAVEKARQHGIDVPGWTGYYAAQGKGTKQETSDANAAKPPMSAEDQAINKGLDAVRSESLKGLGATENPQVGESIGDGWEVVETPPEAKVEPARISPFTGLAPSPAEEEFEFNPRQPAGAPLSLSGVDAMVPRGGYLEIVDADTGQVVGTMDPDTALSRARARIAQAFDPLIENQRDTEGKRAAAIAKDTAIRLVGNEGVSVSDAIAQGFQRYDREMGNATAKSVARGGKGEGEVGVSGLPSLTGDTGISSEDFRLENHFYNNIVKPTQRVYDTKEMTRISGTAASIAAKVKGEKGFSQRQAIRDVLRMTEGAKQTDADLRYALEGGGQLGILHMKLNSWVAGGTLPADYKQQIADYASLLGALNKRKTARAMEYALELVRGDRLMSRLSPEEQEAHAWQAARAVSGLPLKGAGKPKPKKEKSADDEADDLMRELD